VLLVGGWLLRARLDAPGTTIVHESAEPAIARLLEGRDEAALAAALGRRGFKGVVADPAIADPERLPRSSLRNRFALLRTMERFTALAMVDGGSVWGMHEPFDVSRADALALIGIAREVLGGGAPPDPDSVPAFLNAPRGAEIAVILRDAGPAIIWRSAKRGSLLESVIEGANVLRDRWRVRQRRRYGPIEEALGRLHVEIEVFHDRGEVTTRSEALAIRAFEPGIHGAMLEKAQEYRYLLPSVAAHRSLKTAREVLEAAAKETDLPPDGWRRPDTKLWRFRTVHWRETAPRGALVRLERGIPPVGEEVLTRRGLTKVLDLAAHWLAANQEPDGQFAYKYYPDRDQWVGKQRKTTTAQNIVRHSLAAYGTVLAYEMTKKPEYLEAAKRAIDVLRRNSRTGGGPPTGKGTKHGAGDVWDGRRIPRDMRYVEFVDNRDVGLTAKAATVAGAILAISQLALVTGWTPELRAEVDAYGKLLLFLQKPDGSFHHYYVDPSHDYHGNESSIFPGEILFGISRAFLATGDRRYRDAFAKGARHHEEWYRSQIDAQNWDGTWPDGVRLELVQFVPWISMAMNDMVLQQRRAEWVEFGIHGSEWIVNAQQYGRSRAFFPEYLGAYFKSISELPAMHGCVYTEGTAAAYNLARMTGQRERRRMLRRATLLGCRFAAQQLIRPGESDFYLPNPEDARGGIRYALTDNHLRTDYSYHSLSAVYQALKFMPSEDLRP